MKLPAKSPQPVLPSAFSLLRPSWQAIKRNIITVLEFVLIPIIANVAAFIIFRGTHESSFVDLYIQPVANATIGTGYLAGLAAMFLTSLAIGPALTTTFLHGARAKAIDAWPAFKASRQRLAAYIGLLLIVTSLTMLGFIALFIPGLFILQRLYLSSYYLLDQNLTIEQALKASWRQTGRYSQSVWGLLGVMLLFSIISLLPTIGSILSNLLLLAYANAPALRYFQIKKALATKS